MNKIKTNIFLRLYGGTYIARCEGLTASCTMGERFAAEAVAKKLGQRRGWKLISIDALSQFHFLATFKPL